MKLQSIETPKAPCEFEAVKDRFSLTD
jgi:hypothetical protein